MVLGWWGKGKHRLEGLLVCFSFLERKSSGLGGEKVELADT